MEITEILSEFERNRGYFPDKAVRGAMARREEITPRLLDILKNTVENAQRLASEGTLGHLYAMLLLSAFRETKAYPPMVAYSRLPGSLPHDLGGDMVTESLGRILASVFDGDLAPIKSLIEDSEVDEYVRDAGVESLAVLVAAGSISREDTIAYFRDLFHGRLERYHSQVWNGLVLYAEGERRCL